MMLIRFRTFLEVFESIQFIPSICFWLSWYVSVFFELYQTSSRFHDMIQTLVYLNQFKLHEEIFWYDSLFMWFVSIFMFSRFSLFTLFESYHTFYDSIQACCLVNKINYFSRTLMCILLLTYFPIHWINLQIDYEISKPFLYTSLDLTHFIRTILECETTIVRVL